MSKYVTYNCKALKNRELLLAALAKIGYAEGKVEVHAKPVMLVGYEGSRRAETAEIIIRRNNTGVGASNDIGFKLAADGTYQPIVSEYDAGAVRFDAAGNLTRHAGSLSFVQAVENAYASILGDKAINTILRTTVPRMKARGLIPANAVAQRITEGMTSRVVVRY